MDQWLEVIFGSEQLKEFTLTWEVKTTDDVKTVDNLEIEFMRNGWETWEKLMNGGPEGSSIKIHFRRIGHNICRG